MYMVTADYDSQRLLVVSPVHNEAEHLERTARAVAAQRRPPDRWVIVDDDSQDDTFKIAQRWDQQLSFLTVLRGTEAPVAKTVDGLALAREARAFNFGLRAADWQRYTHIAKLDGDIELPPEWFATLLERFRMDANLGIVAGRLEEPSSRGWRQIPIPAQHVHGAIKVYRRECLEAIGGVPERLAWDTIDETYARMLGFKTLSISQLVARHHRHWGSANGRLRGRARHGECAWILHQPPLWVLLRSMKVASVPPRGLSGVAFAFGYARAAVRRTAQVESAEFRRFIRMELRSRLLRRGGRPAQKARPQTHAGSPAQKARPQIHPEPPSEVPIGGSR